MRAVEKGEIRGSPTTPPSQRDVEVGRAYWGKGFQDFRPLPAICQPGLARVAGRYTPCDAGSVSWVYNSPQADPTD